MRLMCMTALFAAVRDVVRHNMSKKHVKMSPRASYVIGLVKEKRGSRRSSHGWEPKMNESLVIKKGCGTGK